ncbi:MAG: hypothetical protein Q9192_006875 [Flavoplaca navasiana]
MHLKTFTTAILMAATVIAAPASNDDNHRALSATKPSLLPHAQCISVDNCDYHPKGLREPIKGAIVHTTMMTVARNVATLTVKPDVTSDVPRPTIKKGTAVKDVMGRPLTTGLAKRMKGVVTIGEAIDMDESEKVKHVWKPWPVAGRKGFVGNRDLEEKKKKEGGVFWRARAAFKGLWI